MADIISFSSIKPEPNTIRLREPLLEKMMLLVCTHYIKLNRSEINLKEWSTELSDMFKRLEIPERSTLAEFLRIDRMVTSALLDSLNEHIK